MTLSDTAEYWQDVKRPYSGPDYYHVPGFPCGHKHLFEAKYIDEVNCRACKKAIAAGLEHTLKSAEQHKIDDANKAQAKLLNRIKDAKKRHPNNPLCSCGFPMIERKNRSTGQQFKGCYNFPECKNTTL
jgi:hypothetical protein